MNGLPVIIMAAGRGTRMRGLAGDRPKHLIEVAGRPFLTYLMQNLVTAGASDIVLVIGHQAQAAYDFALHCVYPVRVVNQFERLGEKRYGTLLPLSAAAPELSGQAVAVVNGDNFYTAADLRSVLVKSGSAVAALPHDSPERFGVVDLRPDGSLEKIQEKPQAPSTNLVNTGLYRFSPAVWDNLERVMPSVRGEYEITDVVNLLAAQEPVAVVPIKGPWLDLGRPEDIAEAERLVARALP